jgi:integrase/recombinase XerC/integrase/recombinase XerD
MTLKAAYDEFIITQQIRGNTPRTVEYYAYSLEQFITIMGADRITESITQNDLRHCYMSLTERNIQSTTLQSYMRALRCFLNWCYSEGYTSECLPDKFKLPKAKRKVIDILTENEIKTLLGSFSMRNIVQYRDYCICLLMLDSGLRMNEVANLTVTSVHIPESYIIVDGKGNKQRIVPIGLNTRKALLKYIARRPPVNVNSLFLTVQNAPLKNNTINLIFQRLKVKTGIKRLRAHLLRHTCATLYLENGGDVYSLQSILGHTTLDMVKKYIHQIPRKTVICFGNYSPVDNLGKR